MNYDFKRPCAHCPFRSDIPPFLRQARAEKISDALQSGQVFPCHKTVDYDRYEEGDGEEQASYIPGAKDQFCAGALILLEREDILGHSQLLRIAMRMGWFDPDALDMGSPVFDSFESFIQSQDP